MPQITTNATPSSKINYSGILSGSNIEKSPVNKLLPNKYRIISGSIPYKNSSIHNSSINVDKDRDLFLDDNIKLKSAVQKLRTENAFYRGELSKAENEIKKKDKLIEDLLLIDNEREGTNLSYINNAKNLSNQKSKEFNLIVELKKQVKEFQKQLRLRDEEIDKLKKQSKMTKLNELLIENRTLNEELQKIKSDYDSSLMKSLLNDQGQVKENKEMTNKMIELEEKLKKSREESQKLMEEIKLLKNKPVAHPNIFPGVLDLGKDAVNSNTFEQQINKLKEDVNFYKNLSEKREKLLNDLQDQHMKHIENNSQSISKLEVEEKKVNENQETIVQLKEEIERLTIVIEEKEKIITLLKEEKEAFVKNTNSKTDPQNSFTKQNELILMEEADLEMDPPLNEEQFGELAYILSKNFEAHGIDLTSLKDKILSGIENVYGKLNSNLLDEIKISEVVSCLIMQLLGNKNKVNLQEMVSFMKYFSKNYLTDSASFVLQFTSLFNTIINYSSENSVALNQQIKQILYPYKSMLLSETRKMDQNNTGYITFYNLKKLLDNLKIELDEDIMEYFIFLMKSFDDPDSYLRDLKYNNIVSLLVEENEIFTEEMRGRSNSLASSQIVLPDKEFKARSENIMEKIAGILYSKNMSTRKFFNQTFVIEEGWRKYNAMYLKLFIKILQDEMSINLEIMDSMCLFNRLKNENNIYNIEVVDIDKLVEEMEVFGIFEPPKNENKDNMRINEIIAETQDLQEVDKHNTTEVVDIVEGYIENANGNENNFAEMANPMYSNSEIGNKRIEEECEINIIYEIKAYMKAANSHFDGLKIEEHSEVIRIDDSPFIKLETLVNILFDKWVISSKKINIASLEEVLNTEGLINLLLLSQMVDKVYVDRDDEINYNKRFSKVIIDGIFSNAIKGKFVNI